MEIVLVKWVPEGFSCRGKDIDKMTIASNTILGLIGWDMHITIMIVLRQSLGLAAAASACT